jgi:hypothetical protein
VNQEEERIGRAAKRATWAARALRAAASDMATASQAVAPAEPVAQALAREASAVAQLAQRTEAVVFGR